jgi:hypothetical protein
MPDDLTPLLSSMNANLLRLGDLQTRLADVHDRSMQQLATFLDRNLSAIDQRLARQDEILASLGTILLRMDER